MRTVLRWTLRLAAVAVALVLAVPAGHKILQADRPMPLPASTWQLGSSQVAGLARQPAHQVQAPTSTTPNTVYIPELGVVLPFHDAGQTDGWLDMGHSITTGVHFADGSTLTVGSYLVAAHVNSKDLSLSPFAKLWQITAGTRVWVTDARNVKHEFLTNALAAYDKNALPDDLWNPDGASQLVLVTCGGKLVTGADGSRHYPDNVVVRATPVADDQSEG